MKHYIPVFAILLAAGCGLLGDNDNQSTDFVRTYEGRISESKRGSGVNHTRGRLLSVEVKRSGNTITFSGEQHTSDGTRLIDLEPMNFEYQDDGNYAAQTTWLFSLKTFSQCYGSAGRVIEYEPPSDQIVSIQLSDNVLELYDYLRTGEGSSGLVLGHCTKFRAEGQLNRVRTAQ